MLEAAGAEPGDVERFVHGMTVGTNALLEGKVARTALLATEGFTDLEELGRQARPELYRLCAGHPPPLVPPSCACAVPERTGPDGVLRELDEERCAELIASAAARSSRSRSACCGAFATASTSAPPRAWPASACRTCTSPPRTRPPACSASTSAARRRWSTPRCRPCCAATCERLAERAREAGLPEPEVMLRAAAWPSAETAARHGSWTVLSGPAGGAVGAARMLAERAGAGGAVCLDMGGTSCDVSVALDGRAGAGGGREVGGRALALPMVDVHTSAPAAAAWPGATRAARCAWGRARRAPSPVPPATAAAARSPP